MLGATLPVPGYSMRVHVYFHSDEGKKDVIPAVKMARTLDNEATLIAQFPPRRESHALKRMLPSSRQITIANIKAAQLLDVTEAPNGKVFRRPEKWFPEYEDEHGEFMEGELLCEHH
ncbi:hypothetical protein [Leucobacter denitrificans]|uniref:Uncharacterized protein n=1 Tax=Leucobacter denitrificans TaxID=683042 RepID=A0A7G9S783_9MICO|nr:hypothetical protein [Leucobacter denitrificans]QNN63708.1 hypothetical protein H9L06_05305 [Leucobacter denitrificans]